MYSSRFLSANWFFSTAVAAFRSAPNAGESSSLETREVAEAYLTAVKELPHNERLEFQKYVYWLMEQPHHYKATKDEQVSEEYRLASVFQEQSNQLLEEGLLISSKDYLHKTGIRWDAYASRIRRHQIFHLARADSEGNRENLIPAFFVDGRYSPKDLEKVCKYLSVVDRFRVYKFFVEPHAELGFLSPLEIIEQGEIEMVMMLAKGFRESLF